MTKKCTKCKEHKDPSEFYERKGVKDGLYSNCKQCINSKTSEWKHNNSERVNSQRRNRYKDNPEKERAAGKKYRGDNPEKVKSSQGKYQENNPERILAQRKKYQENNPDKCAAHTQKWRQANLDKCAAWSAKYRAAKLQATVGWTNDFFIKEVYAHSQLLTKVSGVLHHVDHIVPLQHPLVCGLHCEHNLQVITGSENNSKYNKFEIE